MNFAGNGVEEIGNRTEDLLAMRGFTEWSIQKSGANPLARPPSRQDSLGNKPYCCTTTECAKYQQSNVN